MGIVSAETFKNIVKGFEREHDESQSLNVFCSYSEYDISIGSKFGMFRDLSNDKRSDVNVTLIDVTQQWGLPFENVPNGYRTICKLGASELDLELLRHNLPLIDYWGQSDKIFELTL